MPELKRSFSYASHQCGSDSPTPNCHIYTVTGGSQYYGHLRPAPEGSVRWYTRRTSGMCMCMSPRARWKMVHRSYLYMLSVSVMQAGVTCTTFSNYTACITLTDNMVKNQSCTTCKVLCQHSTVSFHIYI